MSQTFPSLGWFRELAARMAAQPDKYRRLGPMDFTLVPRIVFPDGTSERYRLTFEGHDSPVVEPLADEHAVAARHAVVLEGDLAAWAEMIENIRCHGHADLQHTLNYLTLPDWPFRLIALDDTQGQLDVDRFYRYNQTLQEFFDEAAAIDTRFRPNGGGGSR